MTRRAWLRTHRWLALALGLPLALVALLGALLTLARPLDRLAHPELFRAGVASQPADDLLERTRNALRREFGDGATLTFRPPRAPGETLWVLVRGAWEGTVYVDPASGAERGRRGESDGAVNLMFELHSSLLLGDAGKAVLAGVAAGYAVLLASGLALWWPTRRAGLRIERRHGARRVLLDLHRVGGVVFGGLVLIGVASGAYMAWRPLSAAVTAAVGAAAVKPPQVVAAPASGFALDDAVRDAQRRFRGATVGYVQVPGDTGRPIRVRLRLPDDPHPNGLTSVWLHPATGAVLRADRWDALDPGARAFSIVYPLHSGELGGPAHTALTALLGLVLAALPGTGLWIWWRRRRSASSAPGWPSSWRASRAALRSRTRSRPQRSTACLAAAPAASARQPTPRRRRRPR